MNHQLNLFTAVAADWGTVETLSDEARRGKAPWGYSIYLRHESDGVSAGADLSMPIHGFLNGQIGTFPDRASALSAAVERIRFAMRFDAPSALTRRIHAELDSMEEAA